VIFVGIDPGKKGAIAWMNGERTNIDVCDTPLTKGGDFDLGKAHDILRAACGNEGFDTRVIIEDTISVPHVAHGEKFLPASDKWLHFSLGSWCGLCASLRLPVTRVAPRAWKACMLTSIANSPQAEAMALERRFQDHDIAGMIRGPRGGPKDGRVDALWLAEMARMQWRIRAGVTDRTVQMR
jgi:hypothetical protein